MAGQTSQAGVPATACPARPAGTVAAKIGTARRAAHAFAGTRDRHGDRRCVGSATRRRIGAALTGLYAAALVFETEAAAQSAASDEPMILDPITVEARRREERLIDVPVSTTVLDEVRLEEERIRDIEDLGRSLPSFQATTFGDDPRSTLPIIRGVGALASVLTPNNRTVPTIVDGAPLPGFANALQLLDVEQIELLRGPQGTFFGRNSIAGAINVSSVQPSNEPERTVIAEVGTEAFRSLEARLGGPLGDSLSGRLAVRYQGQDDYLENQQPGQSDLGAFNIAAAAGALQWTDDEATDIRLSVRYEFDQRDTGFAVLLRDSDAFQTEPFFKRNLALTTLNVEHQLDGLVINSTTNFTYYDIDIDSDPTDGFVFERFLGLPPELFAPQTNFSETDEREYQIYQELRAASLPDSSVSWVVGGVASYNEFNEQSFGVSTFFPTTTGERDVDLTTQSYSVFGDVSVPVLERLELGGGLRYTHELVGIDQTFVGDGTPGTVDSFAQDTDRTFDLISGRFAAGFKPTEDSLIYASISRGAKSGGFPRFTNNAALGLPEDGFDETTIWTYEVGAKADLMANSLSLSLATFFNDIKDEAIIAFDPDTFTFPIENLDIETYGFEAELSAQLPEGFDVAAALAFTEAEITGVPDGAGSGARVGNEVPNVPRVAGSIWLNHRDSAEALGLGADSDLFGNVGYRYTGSRFADAANSFKLDPQHIVDARLGVSFGTLEVYLFGENLVGDELEQQGALIAPGVESVLISRGRTVGVGVGLTF